MDIEDKAKNYLRRALFYSCSLLKKTPKKKFLVFGQGRTGSSLLIDLLNSHPKICSDSERLNTRPEPWKEISPLMFPYNFVKGAASRYKNKVYGYKVKIYQIKGHNVDPKKFIKRHISDGWYIIHIWRRSFLDQALSLLRASETEVWHTKKENSQQIEVYLEPSRVISTMKSKKKILMYEKNILSKLDCREVVYEDHLLNRKNRQSICSKIFDDLGLSDSQVYTTFKKIKNTKVENIQEIESEVDSKNVCRTVT